MSTPPLHYARVLDPERTSAPLAPPAPCESRIGRARQLACEIEDILTTEGAVHDGRGYAVRLAQAMARNLIDQLVEIERAAPRRAPAVSVTGGAHATALHAEPAAS
jgi:hypothetical protein